jgi:DNA-binding response OmpR family regulator
VKSRILLVEDEALIAMEIADTLEKGGFEVIGPCQTVSQALERSPQRMLSELR